MIKNNTRKKGFALVEMLVVLAISVVIFVEELKFVLFTDLIF
jgi:prepilin-type N-terminal cleavage/methylation domain-containing protein